MTLFDRLILTALPLIPKPVVGRFSRPYIAGETVAQGMAESRRLNGLGCMVTLDILGEDIDSREEARGSRDAYLELLDAIRAAGIDGNVSLKPTALGLKLDVDIAYENIREIVAHAREIGCFVRIDMEDAQTTDNTLAVYRRLRADFDNVGVVLQACLRRTVGDAEALAEMKANVRLCKGIYREPYRLSWRDREIIRRNFTFVLEILLRGGAYVGIATHDEWLVWDAMALVHRLELPRQAYEFQMLLGVTERLRQVIVESGHRMRVYVPFGRDWYAYSSRRLRENPDMAGMIAKDILGLSQDRGRR
ncbi:MAG: proline dehydrogenase family protein [Candidatus Eisenbacteria bacterium]|uniref:proline dehydrogenase n=1 Tax=Eiseniibacteriota bacterium TaxID=2212470 RepID=A0A937X924_UNCEI|nr:proline dehydrogenase family protein [Candidatus Eisenbacteria bacterium]